MNIVTIGGSGFVGSRFISLLKEDSQNYNIKNVDIEQSYFHPEITEIGDVRDEEQMSKSLKDCDVVVLLAAQHRDDITPTSLYYDVNVEGMKNVLSAMEKNSVKRLIFYSSVAIYGLGTNDPDENFTPNPFNHYGKSKWQAEQVLNEWLKTHQDVVCTIVRPCVIMGERNRGNVYNLLNQIASGKFLMIGSGENKKSMAYVGNIVAFTKYILETQKEGVEVFNYVDKPDMTMNDLFFLVKNTLNKNIPNIRFPYFLGLMAGYAFDLLAKITRKKLVVSSIRIKKFCANSQISAEKVSKTGFKAPYTLSGGIERTLNFEWLNPNKDEKTFKTE